MKFTVLGERCSGTNYLERLVLDNYEIELTWEYGWKHFFNLRDFSNSDDTIFIALVRDPMQWLCSFFNTPHHLIPVFRNNWEMFFTSEIAAFNLGENEEMQIGEEYMTDRNPYTGCRYRNIFELRNVKSRYLLEEMPKLVKNFFIVRYEDLRMDKQTFLFDVLESKYGLKRKSSVIKDVTSYKGVEGTKYTPIIYQPPMEYQKLIHDSLDWSLESRLGYNLG